jgi:hypothetical protein
MDTLGMNRKSGKEMAFGIINGTITAEEVHEWLATANTGELSQYLR